MFFFIINATSPKTAIIPLPFREGPGVGFFFREGPEVGFPLSSPFHLGRGRG